MVSRNLLVIEKTTPLRILTVGYLDYPPNKYGVRHFVESIFPIIRERLKGVEFYVVGKTKDKSFLDYLNSLDGVKALGYVEDVFSEYERCRVVVIPVYHGSGTCVKFAEGLMTNRPMVSTLQGVRGFEHLCEDGEHYLLAKDDKEFADKITCLLTSEDLSRKIAKKAYETGLKNFSQDRFYEIVSNSIV
jgi:glycosyltransferase involved in cell wall biosynthesis